MIAHDAMYSVYKVTFGFMIALDCTEGTHSQCHKLYSVKPTWTIIFWATQVTAVNFRLLASLLEETRVFAKASLKVKHRKPQWKTFYLQFNFYLQLFYTVSFCVVPISVFVADLVYNFL